MFLEEKKQGEVGTKLKLSEAIRRGKPLVREEGHNYYHCALGCAWAGVKGRRLTYEDLYDNGLGAAVGWKVIADSLGFSRDLCETVSNLHMKGLPALEIAAWLEAQGQ